MFAFDPVGIAHEHIRATAGPAQRPLRYRQVIARKVELGVLRLGKQDLVRVREGDFAPGDDEDFSFRGHGRWSATNAPWRAVTAPYSASSLVLPSTLRTVTTRHMLQRVTP